MFSAGGVAVVLGTLLAGPGLQIAFDSRAQARDWRTASRAPMGWAPDPASYEPAVVQAYAARAVRWRGAFAVHCWIAVKPAGASSYQRYEVMGFNMSRNTSVIRETSTPTPDQRWFGSEPILLQDIRGPEAEAIIAAFPAAVASYPYPTTYLVWPGPNSNTFIAHLAREIPALRLALPGNAIGKDYTSWKVLASAPSGTGFQISLAGIFGVMLAQREGIDVNVLGLVFGADPLDLAITIPGVGRLPARPDWTNGKHVTGAGAVDD